MSEHYILNEQHEPVPADLETWARWFSHIDKRRVAETKVKGKRVSTVCLGLDHSFDPTPDHTPILFETMVFEGKHDLYCDRYATWGEAEAGHAAAVEKIKTGCTMTTFLDASQEDVFAAAGQPAGEGSSGRSDMAADRK